MDMDNRPDVDQLIQRMATLRDRLNYDAHSARESIHEMTDWRQIVRRAPWKSLGAALVAGFLLVPKRREQRTLSAEEIEKLTDRHPVIVTREDSTRDTLFGTILGIAGAGAARLASNYVASRLTNIMPRDAAEVTPS
jgi:hypothetical protein